MVSHDALDIGFNREANLTDPDPHDNYPDSQAALWSWRVSTTAAAPNHHPTSATPTLDNRPVLAPEPTITWLT